ncbi:response regulator [Sphingomonas prati]|uniref:Two-component system OmpR family response regulator n=1 Tax=Sphingomonas prati TaxID=1843237 RepID=A0A7W9BT43_9SPHN|nr:response regulator [Sphingomonas prati]MBB5729621.1 two-component system OmpR family response regulator [Sphingomonas prati]GGE76047.1 DNA-binding response regulator [Sphingomonas prati]
MSEQPPRILVVDDDADLRDLVAEFLGANGMIVDSASGGAEMDQRLAVNMADLVVLDLMMPGEDGLSILRRLRKPGGPGVIMLSAVGDDTDRIIGLEVGADDYLAKPCNPRELLARIRAVLRRRQDGGGRGGPERRFGMWTLDVMQRALERAGVPPVVLTDAEFRTLSVFLDRPQQVLTRDQLIDRGRGIDSDVYDRAIDVTISRLRKKLAPDDPIRTVRNEGYMFTLPVQP